MHKNIVAMALTRKSSRNCSILINLQKMVFMLIKHILEEFPLPIELRKYHSLTWKVYKIFCHFPRVIHEIFVLFINEFGHHRTWTVTLKPQKIRSWIFLWPCQFTHYIANLLGFYIFFKFHWVTHVYLWSKKRLN